MKNHSYSCSSWGQRFSVRVSVLLPQHDAGRGQMGVRSWSWSLSSMMACRASSPSTVTVRLPRTLLLSSTSTTAEKQTASEFSRKSARWVSQLLRSHFGHKSTERRLFTIQLTTSQLCRDRKSHLQRDREVVWCHARPGNGLNVVHVSLF